jgi:hypothetical protein
MYIYVYIYVYTHTPHTEKKNLKKTLKKMIS